MKEELDHSIFVLLTIYLGHLPQLFEFVAYNLHDKVLMKLLEPLWNAKQINSRQFTEDDVQEAWITKVIREGRNMPDELINFDKSLNLFLQKALASA